MLESPGEDAPSQAARSKRIARTSRASLLVGAVVAAGALAGALSGFVVARTVDPTTEGAVVDVPPAAATPATAGSGAIDRVLPAIVTVIADLPPRVDANGETVQTQNRGSGIVFDDAGHILTNFHVIEGAESVTIVLQTGEARPARYVGDDSPFTDMAILQTPSAGLKSVPLTSSQGVRSGESVYAFSGGAIVGANSVAAGIVSGVRRAWPRNGVILEDLLQTDAAINHGDSGGALVNARGEVVGLLTTVVRESPNGLTIDGVSFAQSTDSLRAAIDGILRNGRSSRPRIGIERLAQHIEVSPALAAEGQLPVEFGALVRAVAANSPAATAGVMPGDIVVAVNGTAVDFEHPLVNQLKGLRPGQRADLTLQRGAEQVRVSVTPQE